MEKSNDQLIKEFKEEIKKDYPDLSIRQLQEICSAPFKFFKKNMKETPYFKMRFKGLGTFNPMPIGIIVKNYYQLIQNYRTEKIDENTYNKYKELYEYRLQIEGEDYIEIPEPEKIDKGG